MLPWLAKGLEKKRKLKMHYELYRRSAPGQALTDALDELIQNQQITPQLAMRVLYQYDKSMSEMLNTAIKGRCVIKVWNMNLSTFLLML